MKITKQPKRIHIPAAGADAFEGWVRLAPAKALWFGGHLCLAFFLAPWNISLLAIGLAASLTSLTLCAGHSVGLHRLLIHRSFEAPRWLARLLVFLGILVGMDGPFGMMYLHEIRDWAQKQSRSHPLFGHRAHWIRDAWWQLFCRVDLKRPPEFRIEEEVAEDPFYRFLQKTWMLQQIPVALLLYWIGGPAAVIWGISVRVVVSLAGHWLIGHLAHNHGLRRWHIEGASVQGYNVPIPGAGLLTMGESWHNNHHAYPNSARMGHEGQVDPGWWLVRALEKLGLAWNIEVPESLPERAERVELSRL